MGERSGGEPKHTAERCVNGLGLQFYKDAYFLFFFVLVFFLDLDVESDLSIMKNKDLKMLVI